MDSIIICEDKTDKEFLKHLKIDGLNDNNFFILTNKSDFFKVDNKRYKELLIKIETEKCDKVLFVVDADDVKNDVQYGGYNNTKTKLTNALNALSIKNSDITPNL